ncbi:conjugal transfer protein TraG N-terminal domain-containing protein [Methylocaldum sp. MU1018]
MVFDIFSIGDSAFLAAILNAIAMIAGTGHYTMAAGIGAVLGVIMTLVRGLTQYDARGIRYQDMMASILIYLILFAPGVKVTIEDAYTGQVQVVDNVPMGPAVAGSIMSNLGYRLTRLFEQGFSTPSMTEHGFADTLQVMTLVRKNLLSRVELGKANSPNAGGDLENSLVNYVKECTLTGVDLGLLTLDGIMRQAQVLDAIKFDSDVYTTEIYVGGAPKIQDCTDAWATLDTYVKTLAVPEVENVLKEALKVALPGDVQPRIDDALTVLTGGGVSALDYMLASLITPMFEKGVVGRHEDGMKWNKAAMVEQAIQQRNTQWAGEQNLFTRIVRPMMTWIEGFSYAITPLMAFAVMLGAQGIRITGQYFLMLLWIQLWMPILAVVNLYITMAAAGKMAALDAAQFNLPSIYGIYQMDLAIQEWLGVGGMLASSTPAIALMLVYGGSVTATHFLGRMQGGDFVNEKIGSPDIVSPAPVVNMQPNYQHAPLTGATLFGAEKVLPSFQAGKDLSAAVSSASVAMQQASSSFMANMSNTASRSSGLSREGFDAHSAGSRIASSTSQTDKFMRASGEDLAQRYRDTGMSGDDFAAVVGGSAGLPKDLLPVSVSGQLQNQFRVSQSRADEIASDISQRVTEDHGWQTDLARSVAADAQSGTREVASLGLQKQDLSSLQKSATDTVSATETYNQSVSAQMRFGASASYGAAETGRRFAGDRNLMSGLDGALDRFGLRGDAQRLGAEWRASGLIADKDQAFAAAGISLLAGYSSPMFRRLDEHEARLAEAAGYQLLGDAWNAPTRADQLPDRNASLTTQSPEFGTIQSLVDQVGFHDPRNDAAGLDGRVTGSIQATNGRVADGERTVNSAYQTGLGQVHGASDLEFAGMHAEKAEHLRAEISKAANSQQSAAELEYDVVGGSIYNAAQNISGIGASGAGAVKAFIDEFDTARGHGLSIGQAFQFALKAAPEGGQKALDTWADQRVAEAGSRLTPSQQAYYRAAMFESFAGVSLPEDYNPYVGQLSQLHEQLRDEHGDTVGTDIAALLRRAAGQNRADLINLLGTYNATQRSSR